MNSQAQILQAAPNVQLVGTPWDTTPALDKGLVIGGGGVVLLGSVLGLAGQKLGAKIAFGTAALMGLVLIAKSVDHVGNDNGGGAITDTIGGGAILSTVVLGLFLLGRGR